MKKSIAFLTLCWSMSPVAGAQPANASQTVTASARASAAVTEITLERNCFGCPTGSVLVLRRDGTATLGTTGSARSGTESKAATGTLRHEDFEKLAQLAVSQGFFGLDDSYEDPQIKDGPWTTTSVARGGLNKRVFRRDDAGPPTLKALETAIDAVKTQITFAP